MGMPLQVNKLRYSESELLEYYNKPTHTIWLPLNLRRKGSQKA